jgi:hypothetical protein
MNNYNPTVPKSQDENLRLGPYQQAREYYTCNHDETAIRYKVYSNGTRHFFEQCLNCGHAIGSAIAHKDIGNIDDIPQWDEHTENAYQFLIDEMAQPFAARKRSTARSFLCS